MNLTSSWIKQKFLAWNATHITYWQASFARTKLSGTSPFNIYLLTSKVMWSKKLPGQTLISYEWKESPLTKANAQTVSFMNSLQWPIHVINSVDKTKLPTTGKCLTTRENFMFYLSLISHMISLIQEYTFQRGYCNFFSNINWKKHKYKT